MSLLANLRPFTSFTRHYRQAYTKLSPSPSRSSAELNSPGSQDGFLEKLDPAPSRGSFLRRCSPLIISHIITAILYGALLYYVVVTERKRALHGPGIVFSKPRPISRTRLGGRLTTVSSCSRSRSLSRTQICSRRQNPRAQQVFWSSIGRAGSCMAQSTEWYLYLAIHTVSSFSKLTRLLQHR